MLITLLNGNDCTPPIEYVYGLQVYQDLNIKLVDTQCNIIWSNFQTFLTSLSNKVSCNGNETQLYYKNTL